MPLVTDQSETSIIGKADQLARRGDLTGAIANLVDFLRIKPEHVEALTMLGRVYRANGQFEISISVLQKLCAIEETDPWNWFDLGTAYEALKNYTDAINAYLQAWALDKKNARYALYAGHALWQGNRKSEALDVWSIGSDIDPLVRTAQYVAKADPSTKMKSNIADKELRRFLTQMYEDGISKHSNPKRLTTALWPQTHTEAFEYKSQNQKPYMFYAPDLPERPVFDNRDLPWADTLKKATPAILQELNDYLNNTEDYGRPYLGHIANDDENWQHLSGSEDWNALHLFKNATKQSCADKFPNTLESLKSAPLVEMNGNYMEVFFSVLKPKTHIPPHFGLSNSRLTAHLPLIIPNNCEIRVADHVHQWSVGELFLFDDSFDHEARNDSDETRIVLIFETWRPDLDAVEIAALQDSMEIRAKWLRDRSVPTVHKDG